MTERKSSFTTWMPVALLGALAVAAAPNIARAEERSEDGPYDTCEVTYYLTAPYDAESNPYDHIVVLENTCENTVTCHICGEDVDMMVDLPRPTTQEVLVSAENELPTFDVTCTIES